jgi:hypothetical protein
MYPRRSYDYGGAARRLCLSILDVRGMLYDENWVSTETYMSQCSFVHVYTVRGVTSLVCERVHLRLYRV